MEPSAFVGHLHDMMAQNIWGVYVCLFIAPFVQEDAAIVGAASLSLAGMGATSVLFPIAAAGLIASDLWKFWLGRFALTQDWARKFAERPDVGRAKSIVQGKLGTAMTAARFVPGARIALYIAAGYFGAAWPRFAFWVVATALFYVAIVFALFHVLGAVIGEQAKVWLPVGAGALILGVIILQVVRRRMAVK